MFVFDGPPNQSRGFPAISLLHDPNKGITKGHPSERCSTLLLFIFRAHPAAEVLWAETPEGEEAKATPPADQAPSQVMVIIEQLGILAAGVANSRPKESALWYIRPKIGNPAKRRRFPFDFPSKPSHKGAGHEGPEGQQGNAHRAVCTGQILLIFTKNIEKIQTSCVDKYC